MALKTLMILSENWEVWDPRDLPSVVEAAKVAEEAGIDALTFSEHVVMGPSAGSGGAKFNPREFDLPANQPPSNPFPTPMLMMSAIASVTTKIELFAAAMLPVLRHPLQVAKDIATLDLLSKGRFHVWPTVSWQKEEYDALGVPFEKRGKMLDEQLEIWHKAWTESPVSYEGEFYRFGEVWVEPKPWRPGGPPIWIIGNGLHPAALRRLVKYGYGFAPARPITPEDHAIIAEAFAKVGRDPKELEYQGHIPGIFKSPDGPADLEDGLAVVPPQMANGANRFVFKPSQFISRPEELGDLCRRIVARLKELG